MILPATFRDYGIQFGIVIIGKIVGKMNFMMIIMMINKIDNNSYWFNSPIYL